MDEDEVDRWLDAAEADARSAGAPAGGAAAGAPWADGGAWADDPPGGGTRRWRRVAAVAAGVWLVLVVVLVAGRQDDPAEAIDPSLDLALLEPPGAATAAAAPDPSAATDRAADPDATGAGGPSSAADPDVTAAGGPSSVGGPGDDVGGAPPTAVAGAVRALRGHLTTAGPPATYLEWATPTAARPLDAGIWLVELEAIWLAGEGEQLDTAHIGTWAVALADDGQPLAAPWPLAADPAAPVPAIEPPTGTDRLPEVQQGLAANGWADVTALAADPHPLLRGVVIALAEGRPPGGGPPAAAIVWLVEQPHGGLAPLAVTS